MTTEAQASPLISIIVVDGSFRESFHAVDFLCDQTMSAEQFELIWVEYYDQVDPQLAAKAAKYPNVRILCLDRKEPYHAAYCRNAGVLASRGQLIVYADADVVVLRDFLQRVWDEHEKCDDLVMFLYRHDVAEIDHRADWDLAHLQAVGRIRHTSNYGACISVRKQWLLAINGWEQHPVFGSHFNAHGIDMYTRFKNLGLAVKWQPHIHLYHPWHPQSGVSANAYQLQNAVSTYRARHLVTMAYDGLDPTKNVAFPPELAAQLGDLSKQMARRQGGPLGRTIYYVGAIWRKIVAQFRHAPVPMTLPSTNEPNARLHKPGSG